MTSHHDEARRLIETLQLERHPEGGWFRETWRASARAGERERALGTAIYFLLEAGQSSAWHRVDADELWLWHAGAPLDLRISDGESSRRVRLGPGVLAGEAPQVLIPAHHWQATNAASGWALVSCIVVPGFEFSGFTLATPEEAEKLDGIPAGR